MSEQMLGRYLMTKQTSRTGLLVDKVYVTEIVKYTDEYYLAITIDRSNYCPTVIISNQGGMNIEDIAKDDPDSLVKIPFRYSTGINAEIMSQIEARLCLDTSASEKLQSLLNKLFKVFTDKDATLLEINPLVRTTEGEFLCLDSKFTFDNAAKSRQPELFALRDKSQEEPEELEAENSGLVYVQLEGNIGNVVNGAGLAMATNDAIFFYGGKSANFLDAGGQATTETMVKAFEIILRDRQVKVILVNIYGGMLVSVFPDSLLA